MFGNAGMTLLLIICLYKICFDNAGFISSNGGLLPYKEMQSRGKARLLTMWTSRGSSWTLGSLRNLDNMDLLRESLDYWHLGPLAILTSWQFGSSTVGSLEGTLGILTSRPFDNLDLLATWILDLLGHFDISWSIWWFKLLDNLFGSFLGKLLNSWCFGILDSFSVAFPPERNFGYLPQILSLHN